MDRVVTPLNPEASCPQTGRDDQPLVLPVLRQDLSILSGAPGEDGAPTWLLYDPMQNRYYRLGHAAFTMISSWQVGADASLWLDALRHTEASIDPHDLEQVLHFLLARGLTQASTPGDQKRLEAQWNRQRQGFFRWLLTHYLYIRVPLFHPDRFLRATLPYVALFFRYSTRWVIFVLGVVGILLVIRQWDLFRASILHFFNLRGAILFGVTLFFVKALHELGHAYTAKRQGCRVPTMGLAFLIMYPFLYTDTTDAWRLVSRKQRLAIVTAGVKTELALALVATFVWSFLDEGVFRSMAFFVATTSWVTSLSINMSPFMRFDGYYALADWLGAENLQQRAFALARWHLRELLFGLDEPVPEALPRKRQQVFLVYAYSTWIYRFVLFLGIAFLVYHLVFKALGSILFFVEISYFLLLPMKNEIQTWWKNRQKISLNRHSAITALVVIAALTLFFLPWQNHIRLPAVLEADLKTDVFPREDAKIVQVPIHEGQWVEPGQVLFVLSFPELEKSKAMLERRIVYLQTRIDRHIGSAFDLDQLDILQGELAKTKADLAGITFRMARGVVRAPHAGRVAKMVRAHLHQWVSGKTLLAQIVGAKRTHVTAYVQEDQLHRVRVGAKAVFYGNSGDTAPIQATVSKLFETATSVLPHPEVASIYGGPIAVRQVGSNLLKPENAFYKVVLRAETTPADLPWRMAGQVTVEASSESPVSHFWKYAASVFIRESGF